MQKIFEYEKIAPRFKIALVHDNFSFESASLSWS